MKDGNNDPQRADDTGTILEPMEALQSLYGNAARSPAAVPRPTPTGPVRHEQTAVEPTPAALPKRDAQSAHPSGVAKRSEQPQEGTFRPVVRPPTPRLTLLDDGSLTIGEIVRLREQTTLIGRTEGHIRLPHDPLVSSKHAEVIREGSGAACRWILRDVGSSNGTFVCCAKTVLKPDRLIILGSRRYRFRLPQAGAQPDTSDPATLMVDTSPIRDQIWPVLIEATQSGSALQIALPGYELSVGRPGCGNQIELDDPLIAPRHATIRRDTSGEWRIESKPSTNGVWVQISSLRLSEMCRFQCGEQRFLFVI